MPSVGFEELRHGGHRIVDLIVDYWSEAANRRVAPEAELAALFQQYAGTLRDEGVGLEQGVAELQAVLDASMGMSHPLYLGLVNSSPLPAAALGDLVVSALDNNGGASHQGPANAAVEREVVRQLAARVGYPGDGLILAGGTYAALQALQLAKAVHFPEWMEKGPWALGGQPCVYTSQAAHFSVQRAAHVIGLGDACIRALPMKGRGELDVTALEQAVGDDLRQGHRPFLVVATAGTTGTGAIDPLEDVAAVCDERGLWLHVDACYGGAAAMLASYRKCLAGLSRADSIAVDLHKWFFMPLTAAVFLTRHTAKVRQIFDVSASYIPDGDFTEAYCRGLPTSRRASALAIWFGIRTMGWRYIEEAVARNIDLTRHLENELRARGFRVMEDGVLSIACARWEPAGLAPTLLDDLQESISVEIRRGGRAWFATTRHERETWLRFNMVNLHTRKEHVDALVQLVSDTARRLSPR